MNVLLIFVFFNSSGSSLSNATSLAEMTSITKVSMAGNPSSLRFLSTTRILSQNQEFEGGGWNKPTRRTTTQGFFADDQRLDVRVHRRRSVHVLDRYDVVLQIGFERGEERSYTVDPVC